jgi:hypothetical protein
MTDKKQLTREEEADEIIRRLATPPAPRPRRIEAEWSFEAIDGWAQEYSDELDAAIAKAITEEIDKEILEELRKMNGKGYT